MIEIRKHCIQQTQKVSEALFQLNELGQDLTLFVLNESGALAGTLTDGDIRRGLLNQFTLQDSVIKMMRSNFSALTNRNYDFEKIELLKKKGVNLLPVLDEKGRIIKLLNLSSLQSILPLDVIIMAGGEGRRLRPLTESTPKPLLKVGDKPIIEHNIDRLISYGVENFWISIGYLGEQIENYFKDGTHKGVTVNYVHEDKPLGTIGAVNKISNFKNDHVLVINSDILTSIDYQTFYMEFLTQHADLAVATIPYSVNVPYAVLETSNGHVVSFKEKPTYTYHSNAGIYIIRKDAFKNIPDGFFNATDLMETLIEQGKKVISHTLIGYWLDIGNPQDYMKANEDIKHLKF